MKFLGLSLGDVSILIGIIATVLGSIGWMGKKAIDYLKHKLADPLQDAFGKSYYSVQNRTRYKRNRDLWVKKLIDTYGKRESENIYLVPIHTNLDTRYNMGLEETQVNARNTTTFTSPIGNGCVHPVESGYW